MPDRTRLLQAVSLVLLLGCGEDPGAQSDTVRDAAPDAQDATAPAGPRLPPPIGGGTLLLTRDGRYAVASDPDMDRVHVVGMGRDTRGCEGCDEEPRVLSTVSFDAGEHPGRIAEDAAGRVHVVLRSGGAVATIDLESGALLARRPVCAEPRGIVHEAETGLLHVACASGDLVSLSPAGGPIVRRLRVDDDLRDVVVVPGGLVVSRFKTAELLRVDRSGAVTARIAPSGIERGPQTPSQVGSDPLAPSVAWRAVGAGSGDVRLLHQYAVARAIELEGIPDDAVAYGSTTQAPSCGGVVAQTVSTLGADGRFQMGMPMQVRALSVDVAASADGDWLAVAHPGARTPTVTLYRSSYLPTRGRSPVDCAPPWRTLTTGSQPVAVALVPGREPAEGAESDFLVVQTRAAAALEFYRDLSFPRRTVILEAATPEPGHDVFHQDAGSGIACAQCHPEGGEDGRVWNFAGVGPRRTQALNVGLSGTEPFHWSGDLATFSDLIEDTLVHRMGGNPTFFARAALEEWVYALRSPTPRVDPDSAEARRGRESFESPEVACSTCHDGAAVARSSNEDVGVASPERFQIPALRGVSYRAPYMHDGSVPTLRARFESSSDRHGRTSHLTAAQIEDLIRYLESL